MSRLGTITRRTFLVGAAAIAGGVAFGTYAYKKEIPNPLAGRLAEGEATFNPYVIIAASGPITIITPRAEMGQGIVTTLAALVCEELDVDLDQIRTDFGPASAAYYNRAALEENTPFPRFDEGTLANTARHAMGIVSKFLALQMTGGSTSTVDAYEKMRLAGATARAMLVEAAAKRLGVAAQTLTTARGTVTDPASGKSLTYQELALDAAKIAPPSDVTLRDRSQWRILGKSQNRLDMLAKVTGGRIFGVDVAPEGLLHATVRMSPRLGSNLVKADLDAAKGMRGVVKALKLATPFGDGIAVIADNTWRAFQAADAIAATAEWGKAPYPEASDAIEAVLDARLGGEAGFTLRTLGDVQVAFADAARDKIVEAEFFVPFLSHAAMEPMNATAQFKDGVLTIWAPHQSPTVVEKVGMDLTGLTSDKINVITTMMGGGFGRRTEPDFIHYAVMLAKETEGRPVKVTWTREEDMTHSPFRPVAKARYRGVIGEDGLPEALHAIVASPSPAKSVVGRIYPSIPMSGPDPSLIDGAWNQPYAIPNYHVEGRVADMAVPVTFWRSVGYSFNAFMHESFIDMMAVKAGVDPLDLRLKSMADNAPALAVLNKVAEMSGWRDALPAGRARGLAFNVAFGTYVAEVVEVSQGDDGMIRLERVFCAADPGIVLDPENVKAQLMGGIIYGLSAAMNQEITFADGMVEQMNFADHDGLRHYQTPAIAIELVPTQTRMGGIGEPGTPPIAPALANAVFALNGKRLTRMPFGKDVTFA